MAQDRRRDTRSSWLLLIAGVVTLASLAAPIALVGIWDPPELRVAELSRRIACTLLGASELALPGADNQVPDLGELGRGQLPFTSIAIGFRLFGLHEWAGRLPLVGWGLLGVLATAILVARLADRVAAAWACLALATMPVYFLHARTMLGDVVTMAAAAMAVAGVALATFEVHAGRGVRGWAVRAGWLTLGALGLLAGYGARGVLIGVALPALSVGLGWAVLAGSRRISLDRAGHVCGAAALAAGVAACAIGLRALQLAADEPDQLNVLVGATVDRQKSLRTFDFVIRHLGHGLFPWSALLPLAFGAVLRGPTGVDSAARDREVSLRVTLVIASAVGLGVFGAMAPTVGHLPYAPVFALAALAALALRDFDREQAGSRAVAMGVAALAILLWYDFRTFPEKGLSAFAVEVTKFPDSFAPTAEGMLRAVTAGFVFWFFFSAMEGPAEAERRFQRDDYLAWPKTLRQVFGGNLLFGVIVLEAALVGLRVLSALHQRGVLELAQLERLGAVGREVVRWGYLGLPVLVALLPALLLLVRDGFRELYTRLPRGRALGAGASVVVAGLVLSLGYYPALAAQVSPKQVFDSYQHLAAPGEPLATVGVGAGSATYYTGRPVEELSSATVGFQWLSAGTERRWLVVRQKDLAQLNSLHRKRQISSARRSPPAIDGSVGGGSLNLPVLDARSSEILLVSNQLRDGEVNQNPFAEWILDRRPIPARSVDGNFGGQLEAIGWEITEPGGAVVDAISPGQSYVFRIYYEVVRPISGNWETFLHIDGHRRRFNGDHLTLEGKYPLHFWQTGDYIADVHPFRLDPNFTPGTYQVLYGLFIDSRRLEVKRGRHDDDRLRAGVITVR